MSTTRQGAGGSGAAAAMAFRMRAMGTAEVSPEEALAEELKQRSLELVSVQRNYESMSRLMQVKQQELEQAQSALAAEQASSLSMNMRLDEERARSAALDKRLAEARGLAGRADELAAANDVLRRELAAATAKAMASAESVKSLRQQLEAEMSSADRAHKQLDAWRKADTGRVDEAGRLKKELADCQGDMRALASEVRALKDSLARSQALMQAEQQRAAALTADVAGQRDTIASLQEEAAAAKHLAGELRSTVRAVEVALGASKGSCAVLEAQLRGAQRALELAQQYGQEQAAKLQVSEAALAEVKAALEARDADVCQLRGLLTDTEERYQAVLGSRMAADEVSTSLQLQLAQTRGALAEARRAASGAEEEAAREKAAAATAVAAAEARADDASRRLSSLHYRHGEHVAVVGARLDVVTERLNMMGARLSRELASETERVDKSIMVTQQKLSAWGEGLGLVEAVLHDMGASLDQLKGAAIRRQADKEREVNEVRGDAAALRSRVAELEAALAAAQSQSASQSDKIAKAAQAAAGHQAQIKAVQAAADERVEAERARLGAKLQAVEAEVARLQRVHHQEAQAASKVWAMERAQLAARTRELAAELERVRAAQQQEQQGAALAVLHTKHHEELTAARNGYETKLKIYTDQLTQVQGSVRSCWAVFCKLATDMAIVANHFIKMGVEVQPCELPPALRTNGDDGTGLLLAQLANTLRGHFANITQGAQDMVRRLQEYQQQVAELAARAELYDPTDWEAVAADLRSTVASLVHVEESLAPNCTCLMCLDTFKAPVTLIPCGHTYCRQCLANANGLCSECGSSTPANVTIYNSQLDAICSKYEVKRSALMSIQRALGGSGAPGPAPARGPAAGGSRGRA